MPFYFPVDCILRKERTPDVFLVHRLLKRQLLKAYPNTNKNPGRNALLATYGYSQPLQQARPGGLFSECLG